MANKGREADDPTRRAVQQFWASRTRQLDEQRSRGRSDQGTRGAATGGRQMDGFIELVAEFVIAHGVPPDCVHRRRAIELPGYYRPTKQWDMLVVRDGELLCALEMKSHVGPSFGNNFNNRTEEAMGSALDLWTAYREGAFNHSATPWLGYYLLLEDCDASRRPVASPEPHFKVFKEFRGASYARRYELFCRKLQRERVYSACAFMTSDRAAGDRGAYNEPAKDLRFSRFLASLGAHIVANAED